MAAKSPCPRAAPLGSGLFTAIIPSAPCYNYYIILDPDDRRRPTTVRSNDTLVDTPFQLISGFFHVNQGVLCSEHAEQASSRGVLEGGLAK